VVQSAVEVAGGGMTTDDRIAMTTDDLMTDGTLLMTATGAAGVCVCVCVCVLFVLVWLGYRQKRDRGTVIGEGNEGGGIGR
jgi:hypothetical protein